MSKGQRRNRERTEYNRIPRCSALSVYSSVLLLNPLPLSHNRASLLTPVSPRRARGTATFRKAILGPANDPQGHLLGGVCVYGVGFAGEMPHATPGVYNG